MDGLLAVRGRGDRYVFGEGRENDAESCREIRVFARQRGGQHRTLLGDRREGRPEEEGRAVRALDHLERRLRKRETQIVAIRREGHGALEVRGRMRNRGRIDTLIRWNHCWWLRMMMMISLFFVQVRGRSELEHILAAPRAPLPPAVLDLQLTPSKQNNGEHTGRPLSFRDDIAEL